MCVLEAVRSGGEEGKEYKPRTENKKLHRSTNIESNSFTTN